MQISNPSISDLCRLCTWKHQCGSEEPCSHFEPEDLNTWMLKEYINNLYKRQQLSIGMSIEQGNYAEQE